MKLITTLALCSLAAGCARAPVSAADDAPDQAIVLTDEVEPFWWYAGGEENLVTVWFGPLVEDVRGRHIRQWVMSAFLPGTADQLSMWQDIVLADGDDPVGFVGAVSSVELSPPDGLTWRDVSAGHQLQARVVGY